jgi:hypothetical protein
MLEHMHRPWTETLIRCCDSFTYTAIGYAVLVLGYNSTCAKFYVSSKCLKA